MYLLTNQSLTFNFYIIKNFLRTGAASVFLVSQNLFKRLRRFPVM